MKNKRFDIVTIGDCTLDHYIVPSKFEIIKKRGKRLLGLGYGAKIPATEFRLFPGGNPLNTAVGFARLGLNTAIMTDLNDSGESSVILNKIKQERIDTELVKISQTAESNKSIVIVTGGERTVLSYHSERQYSFRGNFASRWIYLTSLGEDFKTIYDAAIKYKKSTDAQIAYNPGSMQLSSSLPAVKKMLRNTQLLFVNMREAEMIAGRGGGIAGLFKKLHSMGAAQVAITDSRKGSYASDGRAAYKIVAFPGKRVDATGAGDSFASGFTAAIARGESVPEAMRWGSVNAASEVGQIGVQNGLLTIAQMRKTLAKHKSYQAKKI